MTSMNVKTIVAVVCALSLLNGGVALLPSAVNAASWISGPIPIPFLGEGD